MRRCHHPFSTTPGESGPGVVPVGSRDRDKTGGRRALRLRYSDRQFACSFRRIGGEMKGLPKWL